MIDNMKITLDNKDFDVLFQQKPIKKTYLRLKKPRFISISSPFAMSEARIKTFILKNKTWILKQDNLINIKKTKNEFCYFGENIDLLKHRKISSAEDNDLVYDYIEKGKQTIQSMFYYAKKIDPRFKNATLVFKKMSSRWGVCHRHKERVVLNSRLIHLPKEAVYYVIVHELAHLIHPNHSKAFYNYIRTHQIDVEKNRKTLKKYSWVLYQ